MLKILNPIALLMPIDEWNVRKQSEASVGTNVRSWISLHPRYLSLFGGKAPCRRIQARIMAGVIVSRRTNVG